MIVTEEEAGKTWCVLGVDHCGASCCMHWRWWDKAETEEVIEHLTGCINAFSDLSEFEECPTCGARIVKKQVFPRRGYCGLSGKPEEE